MVVVRSGGRGGVVVPRKEQRMGTTYVRPVERRTPARKAETVAWLVTLFLE